MRVKKSSRETQVCTEIKIANAAIMAAADLKPNDMADYLGMDKTTFYRRKKDPTSYRVSELLALDQLGARYGIPVIGALGRSPIQEAG